MNSVHWIEVREIVYAVQLFNECITVIDTGISGADLVISFLEREIELNKLDYKMTYNWYV